MRRTLAVVVGACTAVALTGVAGATTETTRARNLAPERMPQLVAPERTATAAPPRPVVHAVPRTAGLPAPRAAGDPPWHLRVGTLERVDRVLGYVGTQRSATLRYPGSRYVKVHFNRLLLLPGDYVTVTDRSGAEVHRVDSDPVGAAGDVVGGAVRGAPTGRWAMSVSGDTAVVTLHRTRPDLLGLGSTLTRFGVGIDRVARGFTDGERMRPAGGAAPGREESVCGDDDARDSVCYRSTNPVAYHRSRAVARLLINGTELCTAFRVGAGNRMLTNNHCFSSSAEAYDTEVWFDYRCAVCGRDEVTRPTKVWGDRVLSTDRTLDYTLFSVDNFAAVRPYGYLQLDTRRPAKGEELYIPQHPGGDPMVIAMRSDRDRAGTCAVSNPTYDGYAARTDVSYRCDTAGGSSGAPVISRDTNRVIALHHLGGCPNSGVRADLIHNRIKRFL